MLLTRHMLFVGYSLGDENFHRLAHDVLTVIGERRERRHGDSLGTALTPSALTLDHELWEGDGEFVSTASDRDPGRQLEVLVDRIVAEAAGPAAHLLDDSYVALFSQEEQKVASALRDLERASSRDALSPASALQ